tara:strand:- start:3160 stop:3702 length:543 start_codon:yes stop_codon:yes gene_type:complete
MSEVSVECQREDIEYWNKKSLNVDYNEEEAAALQELKRLIINTDINNIKSKIIEIINKYGIIDRYGDDIIKTIILKWHCYCTDGRTNNVDQCHREIFETIDRYIDSKVKTRKRSNAVTKQPISEERIKKLELNIQHIRNTLDEELNNKSRQKRRKPSPKREQGQTKIENDEESEYIVLRF